LVTFYDGDHDLRVERVISGGEIVYAA